MGYAQQESRGGHETGNQPELRGRPEHQDTDNKPDHLGESVIRVHMNLLDALAH
jgi:hypothetical protein